MCYPKREDSVISFLCLKYCQTSPSVMMALIIFYSFSNFYLSYAMERLSMYELILAIGCFQLSVPDRTGFTVLCHSDLWKKSYPSPFPNGVSDAWCKWHIFCLATMLWMSRFMIDFYPIILPFYVTIGTSTPLSSPYFIQSSVERIRQNCSQDFSLAFMVLKAFSWSGPPSDVASSWRFFTTSVLPGLLVHLVLSRSVEGVA